MRKLPLFGIVCMLAFATAPVPAGAATGLAQVAGSQGCSIDIGAEAPGACAKVKALDDVVAAAISPDGRWFYAAVLGPVRGARNEPVASAAGITTFARDPQTGALTWVSCVTNDGTRGPAGTFGECADGDALRAISGVAVTPDGTTLITTGGYSADLSFTNPSSSLDVFARDPLGGGLTQTTCFSEYTRLTRCESGAKLLWPSDVAISPDGRDVYLTSFKDDAVVRFEHTASGGLVQRECISNDGSDGACAKGHALQGPTRIVLSGDGRSAYVLGEADNSLVVLARAPETGVLQETSCLLGGEHGACQAGAGIGDVLDIAIGSSGEALYVLGANGVRILNRDPGTGELARGPCVTPSEDGEAGCRAVDDFGPSGGAFAVDGHDVFVYSPEVSWYPPSSDSGDDAADDSSSGGYTVDTLWAFKHESDGSLAPDGCIASAPSDENEHYTGKCSAGLQVGSVTRLLASDGPLYILGDRISVLDRAAVVTARTVRVRAGRASVPVACTRAASRRCAGSLRLQRTDGARRRSHASLARRFSMRGGRHTMLTIPVPPGDLPAGRGTVVLDQPGLGEIRTPVLVRRTSSATGSASR